MNLSDLRPEVDSWRARKTASDVEGIRHATTVVADAIASAFANAPRRSETDFALAARVEAHAREREAEECLCLVGVGADAVVTEPTGCGIESGDSIAVEVTAIVAGYCTQVCMTRPAGISIRAQQACAIARTALVNRMKSGASVAEVVSEGDSALQREGFREAKLYDLGHGVGCDVPELPRLLPSTADVLEEGMVIVAHVGVGDPRLGAAFIGSPVVIGPAGAVELAGEPASVM